MVYEKLANVYDRLMDHAPYDEWVEFTEQMFCKLPRPVQNIVDLGCGTGEITVRLAKKGYEMVGVDYSEEMLTLAQHKASGDNGLSIQWLHQDVRDLEGLYGFDAAISYCDVMNYITEPEDIEAAFSRAFDVLNPGGMFLFDVHHLSFILDNYLNETFAEVTDEASYIWFCTPGEVAGEMFHDLTFFYLNNGHYERFDEQHHQRTFPIEFYKKVLKETGFENIKIYADFNPNEENIDDNTARIFFSAMKQSR